MSLSMKQVSHDDLFDDRLQPSDESPKPPHESHNKRSHQTESLNCPRCNSTNTKFCYYNNYNRTQPRHFCKACKRHWTKGGTLRNVPVGGGRKNKRYKPSELAATTPTSSSLNQTTNNTRHHQQPYFEAWELDYGASNYIDTDSSNYIDTDSIGFGELELPSSCYWNWYEFDTTVDDYSTIPNWDETYIKP